MSKLDSAWGGFFCWVLLLGFLGGFTPKNPLGFFWVSTRASEPWNAWQGRRPSVKAIRWVHQNSAPMFLFLNKNAPNFVTIFRKTLEFARGCPIHDNWWHYENTCNKIAQEAQLPQNRRGCTISDIQTL